MKEKAEMETNRISILTGKKSLSRQHVYRKMKNEKSQAIQTPSFISKVLNIEID